MKKYASLIFSIGIFFNLFSQSPLSEWSYKLSDANDFSEGNLIKNDNEQNSYVIGNFNNTIDCDPSFDSIILTEHNINGDCYIQKIDQNRNLIWAKNIGAAVEASDIIIDSGNNIIITGTYYLTVDFDPNAGITNKTSLGYRDVFILKLNSDGEFLWVKSYGSTGSEESGHLNMINDSSFYFSYGLFVNNFKNDLIFIKMNTSGDEIWSKTFPGTGRNNINSIKSDLNKNIYATGAFSRTLDLDPSLDSVIVSANNNSDYDEDIFILKLDSLGNHIWRKRIGNEMADFGIDLDLDSIGNLYITGGFAGIVDFNPDIGTNDLTGIYYNAFILKMTNDGSFVWVYGTGQNSASVGRKIIYDNSGFLYNTGKFENNTNLNPRTDPPFNAYVTGEGYQTYLRKLDLDANLVWGYYTMGSRFSFPFDMSLDSQKNIYITGWFNGDFDCDVNESNDIFYADASNSFVLKINQNNFATLNELNPGESEFKIYPNPTNKILQISNTKNKILNTVLIKNIEGKILYNMSQVNVSEVKLNIDFPAGIYFIELYSNLDNPEILKFIKE